MQKKCSKCGLVNRHLASECLRCKGDLSTEEVRTGLNPFEDEKPKRFSGGRFIMMLLPVALCGFVTYQFLKPEVPPPAKFTPEQMEQERVMQNSLLEYQKKELQRQANMKSDYDVYKNALSGNSSTGLSRTKYDVKQWDPVGSQPRPGSGGYQIPPYGTVYSQDKYGGMHQVR